MRGMATSRKILTVTFGVLSIAATGGAARALTLPDTGNCSASGTSSCLTINQNQQVNAGTGLTVNSGGVSVAASTAFGNGITATVTGTAAPTGFSAVFGTVASQYNRGVEG